MAINKHPLFISAVAAVLIGVAQYLFVAYCWAYIAGISPLSTWVAGFTSNDAAFNAIMWPADYFIDFVLALPAAFVLISLRPRKLALYLPLAVLPAFFWTNRLVIGNPQILQLGWWPFAGAWAAELFAVPVAVWFLAVLLHGSTPNSSSKRTPEKPGAA